MDFNDMNLYDFINYITKCKKIDVIFDACPNQAIRGFVFERLGYYYKVRLLSKFS